MPPENVNIRLNEAYDNKDVLMQIALLKKGKQDKLTAGDNITIEGNVISAEGSEAVWGSITGDLNDQTDLKNELSGIVDRVDDNAEAIEALDTSKADVGVSYTKSEEDALLSDKADVGASYTKNETDTLLSAKADVGTSYTKAEEDAKLGAKQNELTAGDGIVISGPQNNIISATVPAQRWGNITGDLGDQTDLDNRLSGIETDVSDLEQAVEDLDTEKADASDVYSQTVIDGKVTDIYTAIDGVASSVVSLDDNTYKKSQIDTQMAGKQGTLTAGAGIGISANNTISCTVPGFSVQVVSILPATGVEGVIYLVPLLGPTSQNIYNEFIWVNSQWEQIGTTEIDLSDYKVWTETKNYIDDADDALRNYIGDVSTAQSRTQGNLMAHERDTTNPHMVSKAQVGLSNVDNTSDANKPISTATQTALNGKADVGASYTKSEEDALLAAKASTAQLITGLNGKADAAATYSKADVDYLFSQRYLNQIHQAQDIGITKGNMGYCCPVTVPKNGVYIITGRINNTTLDSGEIKIGMGEIGGPAAYFAHGVYPDRPANYGADMSFTISWGLGAGTTIYLWIENKTTGGVTFHGALDVVYLNL